ADCNLRLSAPQVSRRHCFIRVGREGASVTDLDSSNGTFLEGKRISSGKRYELTDGSVLSLGPIRFRVSIQPEVVSDNSPAVSDSVDASTPGNSRSSSTVIQQGDQIVQQSGDGVNRQDANTLDIPVQELPIGSDQFAGPPVTASPDSRAEIVDLGRHLAEREGFHGNSGSTQLDLQNNDDSEDSAMMEPGAQAPQVDDSELESVEIVDDETAREPRPVDIGSDGSEEDSAEPVFEIDEDADFLEEDEPFDVIEVIDTDEDDEDNGDDELQKFLKGL
ncbi:MAG: FHA domain-containing protein, partial [Planctomycetaceae bacterium]|nr:FHA domain-containing protein [Planctomycetaceae bacterium]